MTTPYRHIDAVARLTLLLSCLLMTVAAAAQSDRRVQNRPYADQRLMHFGILVGMHLQDLELDHRGPYTLTTDDGTATPQDIVCDVDNWSPGFSVGVVGDVRLSEHFALRLTPTMHFGAKHLTFLNMNSLDAKGRPVRQTQDMKNTYVSLPIDLKFSGPRWNNYRPYLMAGVNPMINLTSGDQDLVRINRYNTMIELGLGCDFYLPFFKLIPELKFCFGLGDVLDHHHVDELRDANMKAYAASLNSARSKMIVLTFYFE